MKLSGVILSPKLFTSTALLIATLWLQGCSLFETHIDPKNQNVALVYGYLDMTDAPSAVDWVFLQRFKPGEKEVGYYMTAEDGYFYHLGVDMGSYQVVSFGRNTRWYSNTTYHYDFDNGGRNDTARRITKPGVYFIGSYAYKNVPSGSWFKEDKFQVQALKTPTEKEILKKVLERMEDDNSEYTYQIGWIKKRLAEL